MEENSNIWCGTCNVNEFGIVETPPMSETQFRVLLESQKRDKTCTDQAGYFIQGCVTMLNVELRILCPNYIRRQAENCEPFLTINKNTEHVTNPIFYIGLLQTPDCAEGHYQVWSN